MPLLAQPAQHARRCSGRGTVLFAINQLDVVLAGRATTRVWLKAAITYVVPFVVANYGLPVGAHGAEPGREEAALKEVGASSKSLPRH